MQTEIDIKEFENKVVKTFCNEYFKKAFSFLKTNQYQIENIGNIQDLIQELLKLESFGQLYLYEPWIDNSFKGFEACIEKNLLLYPPTIRGEYKFNSTFQKNKNWLYQIFYEVYKKLIAGHPAAVAFNDITGEYNFEIDSETDLLEIEAHRDLVNKSLCEEKYAIKLNNAYKTFTRFEQSIVSSETGDTAMSNSDFKVLKEYFKINGLKKTDAYFQNNSKLFIRSQEFSYKQVKFIVASIEKAATKKKTAVNAYAFYWLNKINGETLYSAAIKHGLEPDSLDRKAEKRLIEQFYYELKKLGF